MLPAETRAAFFDAVGTLLYPHPSAPTIYAQVGQRYGSQYDPDTILERFRTAFAAEERIDRQTNWCTSEEREQERWRRIISKVLDDVFSPQACFQELFEHFGRSSSWQLAPNAETVITFLRQRDIPIGLASNYDSRLHRVIAGFPVLQGLDAIVISSEVRWRKPAGKFFQALARRVALKPQQILFVGDDWENDFVGGKRAGMSTILFDPWNQYPEIEPRITRLDQLIA